MFDLHLIIPPFLGNKSDKKSSTKVGKSFLYELEFLFISKLCFLYSFALFNFD